jgi:hypothetical protein
MLDPNRIFGLFDAINSNDGVSEDGEVYVDIKDTPEYKVGMFTRIIMDHLQFNDKVINFFSRANDELEKEDIENAGEFVVYNRGWYYIKGLDLKNKKDWYAIEKMANLKTLTALELSIHYFEEREEYEKCAHIVKISKAIEEFIK